MIVIVAGPVAAVLEADNVSTLLAPVVEGGLKLAVTPLGRPLTLENMTLPANPPVRVMLIVAVPLAPCAIDKLEGLADREKSGVVIGLTVSAIAAVCVSEPLLPVMVTVA